MTLACRRACSFQMVRLVQNRLNTYHESLFLKFYLCQRDGIEQGTQFNIVFSDILKLWKFSFLMFYSVTK